MSAKMRSTSLVLKRALVPTVAMATLTSLMASLMACSPSKWKENPPKPQQPAVATQMVRTGDPVSERQIAPPALNTITVGQPSVVVPSQLPARSKPDDDISVSDITYEKGDVVVPTGPAVNGQVPVVPADPKQAAVQGPRYVPQEYLASEPVPPTPRQKLSGKFFVIQNIATQKLRVYERCEAKDCPHHLILETEMVAGEDTPDHRTLLGSFRITEWLKFYEDGAQLFPSYYNPAYPALPQAGSDIMTWASKSLLPNGRGLVRGSFGWYTAKIGPDPTEEQWLHGTWGRAADGDKFIRLLQTSPLNHTPNLASHGCTRVENQAIAFMRELLPLDTPVIKVYAMEKLSDGATTAGVSAPSRPFSWILTKHHVDVKAPAPAAILDQGEFIPNSIPHVRAFGDELSNLYNVPAQDMQGYLIVDQGRLVNYGHPVELRVGGNKPYNYIPSMALLGPVHMSTVNGIELHPALRLPRRPGAPHRMVRPYPQPILKLVPGQKKPVRLHKPILKPVHKPVHVVMPVAKPGQKPVGHPDPIIVKKPTPKINVVMPPLPRPRPQDAGKPEQKPLQKPVQKPAVQMPPVPKTKLPPSDDHVTVQKPPPVPVDHDLTPTVQTGAPAQKPVTKKPTATVIPAKPPVTTGNGASPAKEDVPGSIFEN